MIEHGLYSIKQDFLLLVKQLGGDCDVNFGNKRPVYCCIKDKFIDGLYWAIPTSDLKHRNDNQTSYYDSCLKQPDNDLRSCYYHIAMTTKEALYKISSCYPIIDKYIDHEYTTFGQHVIMKKKSDIEEIERKLKRILAFEFRKPNYFPQHISDIRSYLIAELSSLSAKAEVAPVKE